MGTDDENECPICATVPRGKIFQCREGHFMCELCLRKIQERALIRKALPKCPSCSSRLDDEVVSRCRVLENILDRLLMDCRHSENGCRVKLKRGEIRLHESTCMYGEIFNLCEILEIVDCNFKLSVGTAKDVFQHMKSKHPSKYFMDNPITYTWKLQEMHKLVAGLGCDFTIKDFAIIRVPARQTYVIIVWELSKNHISFYSVDLSLSISEKDNIRLVYSIPNDSKPALSWSFPVAGGIHSWKFLRDKRCIKPIVIDIQSMLQYCDDNGILPLVVEAKAE